MLQYSFIDRFNERAKKYIVPIETPVDEAVYKPKSFFSIPDKEANEYKFKAIKYAFKHHYENNAFYRKLCREKNVTPDDIKSIDDFVKIPMIPHEFFKEYPSGREFAVWLANIMSIELPKVVIKGKNPTYDEVIDAFKEAGIVVAYSSGTTGRFTFIPRDEKSYKMAEYSIAKSAIDMLQHWWDYDAYAYLLFPDPRTTNIYVGKVTAVLFDMVKDTRAAIETKITTDLLRISMGNVRNFKEKMMSKFIRSTMKKMNEKMVNKIIKWAEERDKNNDRIIFAGAPFILNMVMDKMEEEGLSFDFGDRGAVLTGGGWKTQEASRLPVEEFRKKVEKFFGIPSENCLDLYAMVEGNGYMVHCPQNHMLHIPKTYFHPFVLDEEGEPVGEGEEGRFAFLDAIPRSYPGFIITGDKVKLRSSCECGREGYVLEPEISRIKGEEIRGCAEEMRRIMMGG
jgi:phenylacetate-coenzyme A ligase PaaK-like adenylate-forming protein